MDWDKHSAFKVFTWSDNLLIINETLPCDCSTFSKLTLTGDMLCNGGVVEPSTFYTWIIADTEFLLAMFCLLSYLILAVSLPHSHCSLRWAHVLFGSLHYHCSLFLAFCVACSWYIARFGVLKKAFSDLSLRIKSSHLAESILPPKLFIFDPGCGQMVKKEN